jgi:putative chitinase
MLTSSQLQKYNLNSKNREAMFLAQCYYESGGFKKTIESFNYSADGLLKNFSKRFTKQLAISLGRTPTKPANQEAIANIVYSYRMGNGNIQSGDGWKYRGRGYLQITGKYNYQKCGEYFNIDMINYPDILLTGNYPIESALWFWNVHKLAEYEDNVEAVTQIINGGLSGIAERKKLYNEFLTNNI